MQTTAECKAILKAYSGLSDFTSLLCWIYNYSQEVDYIESFWVHGSRVTNTYHRHSDLDIAFIIQKGSKNLLKTKLVEKIHRIDDFPEYFLDTTSEYWEWNGFEIGIHIYTKEELYKKLEKLSQSIEHFENNQAFAQHQIIESLRLIDKDNLMKKAYLRAIAFPENLRDSLIRLYSKRIKQKFLWWSKRPVWKSVFEEITDIKLIIEELAKLQYAINKKYYMYALKDYSYDLKKMSPDIEKEMQEICTITPRNFSGERKRKVIIKAFKKLTDYYEHSK